MWADCYFSGNTTLPNPQDLLTDLCLDDDYPEGEAIPTTVNDFAEKLPGFTYDAAEDWPLMTVTADTPDTRTPWVCDATPTPTGNGTNATVTGGVPTETVPVGEGAAAGAAGMMGAWGLVIVAGAVVVVL